MCWMVGWLDGWRVKHVAYLLTLEQLQVLNIPVITVMNNGEFVWVTKVTDSIVYYLNSMNRKKNKSKELFEQEWSRVAIAIEDVDKAGEANYKEVYIEFVKRNILLPKYCDIAFFFPVYLLFPWQVFRQFTTVEDD